MDHFFIIRKIFLNNLKRNCLCLSRLQLNFLKDPRTAEAAYKLFGNVMAQNEETAENSEGEADAEMLKAILEGAPLKSLVSLGAMTGEEQEQVIAMLNRAMGSEQREEK